MRSDPFRSFHVGSLALCAVFLPWSTSLLSISQMLLVANWISEGIVRRNSGKKWSLAFGQAPFLLFMSFLGLHVIGLIWTSAEGIEWGLDLVRILLPVLVFGVVLSASPRLDRDEFRLVLLAGAWSVIISTAVCSTMRGLSADHRELSMFISHIRLALLICLSIAILVHFWPASTGQKILHAFAILWSIFFIDRLESLQSIVILLVIAFVLSWHGRSVPTVRRILRPVSVVVVSGLIIGTILAIRHHDRRPFSTELPVYSEGGERYVHESGNTERENGELVWSKIAWAEVHRTWQLRSPLPLDTLDKKGHILYSTLFRYLSSMHLPKDSVGIMSLTDHDIDRIVNGTTSYKQGTRWRSQDRLDEVFYELDRYRATGDPSGHSVTMRLEYWRVGWEILKKNWLIGVGTGDTQIAFDRMYEEVGTKLSEEWRHRAHNQYLTLFISFGVIGGSFALFSLWYPARELRAWRDPLFIAWLVIIVIGSLSDDTIETQAGATLFALYYALFVFASPVIDHPARPEDRKTAPGHRAGDDLTLIDASR